MTPLKVPHVKVFISNGPAYESAPKSYEMLPSNKLLKKEFMPTLMGLFELDYFDNKS